MVLNSNTLDFLWLQDGEQGTPGADGSSLYTWVKYSQAADGSHMTDDPTDAVYIGIAYNKTSATESTDPEDYSWSKIKGENGDDGTDGEDAYTIILTNENVSFSTDKTNLPLTNQSATCGILVYKGSTPITTYTIGRVTAPTGIGVSQTTNSIILSVSASVTVPNDNGQVQIPITIGSITVTKQIAYSLSKQGDDGRGIDSTAVHYIASTNGVSPPSLTANWLNEIPVLQAGEYLWTRTTTNYTDGTSLYGYSVSKDGRGVATVTNEYKISKSNTNPDAGRSDGSVSNWNAVRPTDVGTDEYLWIRYKYTYDDGSTPTYSDAIYDSTIDGISSILDTENRTLKDTVWETAYFTVVDPDTGETIQMNIKNTIVESVTDITGIEQRVSTTETNLGDFTNSEYTLFKQSVNQFQTEVSDNLANTTTIATQTAEDFSWMFSKSVYDAYIVDEDGNYVIDENGNFIKAEKESPDGSARITFTREGIDVVNGIISIKAPNGETTIIEGGKINTNRIVSIDGTSWINLGLGTFNYGDKLIWDGVTLYIDGTVKANDGYIGGEEGWVIEERQLHSGSALGNVNTMYLGTYGLGYAVIGGHSDDDWRFTIGNHFGITGSGYYVGDTSSHIWYDGENINIQTDALRFSSGDSVLGKVTEIENKANAAQSGVDSLSEKIDESMMDDYRQLRRMYIDFNETDGLMIGDRNVTEKFFTNITNDELSFKQGKDNSTAIKIAFINSNKFFIQNGEITKSLRIGNFVIAPDPDGSLGFKYAPVIQNS